MLAPARMKAYTCPNQLGDHDKLVGWTLDMVWLRIKYQNIF
jgi:hypothetical protein